MFLLRYTGWVAFWVETEIDCIIVASVRLFWVLSFCMELGKVLGLLKN